jgi:FkbM family methyltransferase
MVPTLRGEVSLGRDIVITTLKTGEPIIVKKNDGSVGNQLRFSGYVRSKFDEVVHSFHENAKIIVEVGAHFGYRTVLFGKHMEKKGKVYAFEPNIGLLSLLKKSLILNDLKDNVILKNMAISDHSGNINIIDELAIDSTRTEQPRYVVVNCNTLDDEMKSEENPIDLLSIDIPGSEFSILRGSYKMIDRSPNIVIVVAFDNDPVSKDAPAELQKLANMGFYFYCYDNQRLLTKLNITELLQQKEVILVITKKNLNGNEVKIPEQ